MTDDSLDFVQLRYMYAHRVVDKYPGLSEEQLEDLIYREWDEFDRVMAEHDRRLSAQKAADNWEPTRWFKAVGPDGSLWSESSNEVEVRGVARPGDQIFRLWETAETEWRPAGEPDEETRQMAAEWRRWLEEERAANNEA